MEAINIKRIRAGEIADINDRLAVEEPLEIRVAYDAATGYITKNISMTMRTPGNDRELAIGFLFNEGIIKKREEIKDSTQPGHDANTILITLDEASRPFLKNAMRNFYTNSACGVCGRPGGDVLKTDPAYADPKDNIRVAGDVFYHLPAALRRQQNLFESTGGLHASALFDLTGKFLLLYEDIGRHNALDKTIGICFLNDQLPLSNCILLLSGRASFELLQKAAMAGIKIVAAIGAPSSLAVQVAEENNITLIGFLKNDGFNIYTGQQRIII